MNNTTEQNNTISINTEDRHIDKDYILNCLLNDIDYEKLTFKDREKSLINLTNLYSLDTDDYDYLTKLIDSCPFNLLEWEPDFKEFLQDQAGGLLSIIASKDDIYLLKILLQTHSSKKGTMSKKQLIHKITPYVFAYGAIGISLSLPIKTIADINNFADNFYAIGRLRKESIFYFKSMCIKIDRCLQSAVKNGISVLTIKSVLYYFTKKSLKYINSSYTISHEDKIEIMHQEAPLWFGLTHTLDSLDYPTDLKEFISNE